VLALRMGISFEYDTDAPTRPENPFVRAIRFVLSTALGGPPVLLHHKLGFGGDSTSELTQR
jgi:hypothetical protein